MSPQLEGQRLAHFVIGDKLGAGGMGVVYRAQDENLGRTVAIKVLPGDAIGGEEARQRFFREARLAAQLSHPNIATVHEIGEADGQIYIVMECVEGESLREMLSARVPSLSQSLSLAADLAAAVAVAHEAGIVHRDLKPDNVMMDRYGHLKVLDFGIAKLQQDDAPAADGLVTAQGRVLGTPGYMSPEQAAGKSSDHRTDIFAVGVILYEMLTGERPFQGSSSMDVIIATSRDEPKPAPLLNPQVSPALDAVLSRCLAKEPAQRWATSRELAARLEQLRQQVSSQEMAPTQIDSAAVTVNSALRPSTTAGVGLEPRPASAPQPNRRWVAVVGAAALLASLAAVALWLRDTPDSGEQEVAETDEPQRLRQPKLGVMAIERYRDPGYAETDSLNSAPMWAAAANDFEKAATQPGAPKDWRGAELFCRGHQRLLDGQLEEADKLFRQSIELGWSLAHIGLSKVLAERGRHGEAIDAAQAAQRAEPKLWLPVSAAARAYALNGDYAAAITEYRRALKMAPRRAALMSALALAYHAHEIDEAADLYAKKALEANPDDVSAHVLLAERALERKDGATALELASRAVSIEPRNVSAWLAQGDAQLLVGQKGKAKKSFETALKLYAETKQRGAPDARLAEVREALAQEKLPSPRAGDAAQTRTPAAKSRARAPKLRTRAKPARTKAAPPRADAEF